MGSRNIDEEDETYAFYRASLFALMYVSSGRCVMLCAMYAHREQPALLNFALTKSKEQEQQNIFLMSDVTLTLFGALCAAYTSLAMI